MPEENNNQYEVPQQDNQQQYYQPPQQPPQGFNQFNGNMPPQEEKVNVGLAIVSFLIPVVGLVLYLTQKQEKPKTAKACGKAALACVIISFVFGIISGVASFFFASKAVEESGELDSAYSQLYDDLLNEYSDELTESAAE